MVEDAEPLRDLVCQALSVSGCTVLSAPEADEALRILSQQKGMIHLLITDVIMPGMNGPALAKQVRALRPEMKILYMTGYSGEFVRSDMLIPGVSFIQKPFTPADLRRKIRKMLSDKPAAKKAAAAAPNEDRERPRTCGQPPSAAQRSEAPLFLARRSLSSFARPDSRGRLSPRWFFRYTLHPRMALCRRSSNMPRIQCRPYSSTWTAS